MGLLGLPNSPIRGPGRGQPRFLVLGIMATATQGEQTAQLVGRAGAGPQPETPRAQGPAGRRGSEGALLQLLLPGSSNTAGMESFLATWGSFIPRNKTSGCFSQNGPLPPVCISAHKRTTLPCFPRGAQATAARFGKQVAPPSGHGKVCFTKKTPRSWSSPAFQWRVASDNTPNVN